MSGKSEQRKKNVIVTGMRFIKSLSMLLKLTLKTHSCYTKFTTKLECLFKKTFNWQKVIGCVTERLILEILPNEKRAKLAGYTIPFRAIAACFVCILPQTFENDQKLLETVVHEVTHCAHFLSGNKGRPHGAEFRQCGRRIIKTLKGNIQNPDIATAFSQMQSACTSPKCKMQVIVGHHRGVSPACRDQKGRNQNQGRKFVENKNSSKS